MHVEAHMASTYSETTPFSLGLKRTPKRYRRGSIGIDVPRGASQASLRILVEIQ